jgi:sec-independent protein translocase protein TatA
MSAMLAFLTPGPIQLVVVLLVVLLLFGNRLPSVMRSLGLGITEFKKGIQGELPESSDHKDKLEDQQ